MQKKEMRMLSAAKANDFASVSKVFMKFDKAKAKGKNIGYVDVDAKNSEGATILHFAAKYGNIEMIEELLSRGSIIDAADKNGWRPLTYASAHNRVDAIEKLIDWGSEVNVVLEENSPIHIAAALGHKDVVKVLMKRGANIQLKNQRQKTPVAVACENNNYSVVNILLSASPWKNEEFDEETFKCNNKKSSSPSIIKTSTLPAAKSSIDISNMYTNRPAISYSNSPSIPKLTRCTLGSQELVSSSHDYAIHTFKSNSAQKCESLNTIFIQENSIEQDKRQGIYYPNQLSKSNTFNNSKKCNVSPQQIKKSDTFKIKSILLPLKNYQVAEQKDSRIGIVEQRIDDPSAEESRLTCDNICVGANKSILNNSCEMIKFRENRNTFRSLKVRNKMIRASLPLQSEQNVPPISPSRIIPMEISFEQRLNEKTHDTVQKINGSSRVHLNTPETHLLSHSKSMSLLERSKPECGNNFKSPSGRENDESCQKWIKSIGLYTIWDILVEEGFDSFLALSLASNEELIIITNHQFDIFNVLKRKLVDLNIPCITQLKFSSIIHESLTQIGLEIYYTMFSEKGYFHTRDLPFVSEKLMNQLGIIKIGHRRLILECLNTTVVNESGVPPPNPTDCYVRSSTSMETTLPLSPVFRNEEKCNTPSSLSMISIEDIKPTKGHPPPIPPRSCSILTESHENIILPNKSDGASSSASVDPDNLDEIVMMLTNLSKELENELNCIE